eukprot:1569107-Rhodomonas_salina.2
MSERETRVVSRTRYGPPVSERHTSVLSRTRQPHRVPTCTRHGTQRTQVCAAMCHRLCEKEKEKEKEKHKQKGNGEAHLDLGRDDDVAVAVVASEVDHHHHLLQTHATSLPDMA